MSKLLSEFCKVMRTARAEKDFTFEDVSKITGLGKNNLCQIEKGNQFPNMKTMEKIINCLGVKIKFTIKGE